jgi:hypothetical protein
MLPLDLKILLADGCDVFRHADILRAGGLFCKGFVGSQT